MSKHNYRYCNKYTKTCQFCIYWIPDPTDAGYAPDWGKCKLEIAPVPATWAGICDKFTDKIKE